MRTGTSAIEGVQTLGILPEWTGEPAPSVVGSVDPPLVKAPPPMEPSGHTFVGPKEGSLRAILRPIPLRPELGAPLFLLTLGGRAETYDSICLQEILHRRVLELDVHWNFVVNLTNLEYLSSTALRIFLDFDLYKAKALHIVGAREKLVRSFEAVGLSAQMRRGISFHPSLEAASRPLRLPADLFDLCTTDGFRVGRDPRSFAKEVDLLKWSSRERFLDLPLARELFRMERLYNAHFARTSTLVVPSEHGYGVLIFKHLKRTFEEAGLFRETGEDPRRLDEDDLEVITKELLENAVDHGYHGGRDGLVAVETRRRAVGVELAFSDFGAGYNPAGFLRRMVGRGGLGLTRLQRIFSREKRRGDRRTLEILSPSPIVRAPLLRIAGEVYPDRKKWSVGPGTTVLLTHF